MASVTYFYSGDSEDDEQLFKVPKGIGTFTPGGINTVNTRIIGSKEATDVLARRISDLVSAEAAAGRSMRFSDALTAVSQEINFSEAPGTDGERFSISASTADNCNFSESNYTNIKTVKGHELAGMLALEATRLMEREKNAGRSLSLPDAMTRIMKERSVTELPDTDGQLYSFKY